MKTSYFGLRADLHEAVTDNDARARALLDELALVVWVGSASVRGWVVDREATLVIHTLADLGFAVYLDEEAGHAGLLPDIGSAPSEWHGPWWYETTRDAVSRW